MNPEPSGSRPSTIVVGRSDLTTLLGRVQQGLVEVALFLEAPEPAAQVVEGLAQGIEFSRCST